MIVVLKIKTGPKANKIVALKEGLIIGRSSEASEPFDDPKMSSKHVEFKRTLEGWVAIDLGSKNGFRVNGERFKKSLIIPGSYIKIGGTEFEAILVDSPPKAPTKEVRKPPLPPARPEATIVQKKPAPPPQEASVTGMTLPPIPEEPAAAPAPVKIERLSWPEYFAQFIQMSSEKVRSKPREIKPFPRAVQLSVLKGLQSETVWTLGYGPREVGPHSVDLVIEDPGAPPICFSVFQKNESVYFATDRPDVVFLNNSSVKTDTLKDGDLISFASTTIKFSFIE